MMKVMYDFRFIVIVMAMACLPGCWGGSSPQPEIVVNSLQDLAVSPDGTVTVRDAIEQIESGGKISFADSLDGGTIDLSIIGEDHSILKGEVFTLLFDPMPPHWSYDGFLERDYGASALYAAKKITIDASDLPNGITLNWTGGDENPARVLAVYGNLTMENVNISSGVASAVFLTSTFNEQNYTLARGAGVAVWGEARLIDCEISGNRAYGDTAAGRDRGAFGGGLYGDVLILEDCVIAGNSVKGYGAAGGGVYSVGGADSSRQSGLTRCAISGNSVQGQHAYGGGIYSDGGGRGNRKTISLESSTLARNTVRDHPDIETDEYYYRGGGFYMSNGILNLEGCTIAQNAVSGYATTFNGEPNMSGGGVAATVGDAHVVENMEISHSIIAGNTVDGEPGDMFTGSLLDFYSFGYNLIGDLNFDYILTPIPPWFSLSRKHWPKEGDVDGILVWDVLSVGSPQRHPEIVSVGTDAGENVVLWYPPAGAALDTVPSDGYLVPWVMSRYQIVGESEDDFLEYVLDQVDNLYGLDHTATFGTVAGITFYGPADTWPSNSQNTPWITFWRDLDSAIGDSLGTEKLADDFWGSFSEVALPGHIDMDIYNWTSEAVYQTEYDQLGTARPVGGKGDVGAIEVQ